MEINRACLPAEGRLIEILFTTYFKLFHGAARRGGFFNPASIVLRSYFILTTCYLLLSSLPPSIHPFPPNSSHLDFCLQLWLLAPSTEIAR